MPARKREQSFDLGSRRTGWFISGTQKAATCQKGRKGFREKQSPGEQKSVSRLLPALKQNGQEKEKKTKKNKKLRFFCINQKSGQTHHCYMEEGLEVLSPREGLLED